MEYILNKSPIRTTENFKVNDFKIDLDIKEKELGKFIISDNVDYTEEIKTGLDTKIGLSTNKYIKLDVSSDNEISFINYDHDYLSSEININKGNFIIIFKGSNSFINTKININSNSNISIINLTDKDSKTFISIENNSSNSIINFIELGGRVKVSNYYTVLNNENDYNEFNSIYLGKDTDKLDMNYYIGLNNKCTEGYINTYGSLRDNSIKTFKGTIDFFEGSSKSTGEENENCILLSDTATSRSLPMLLCHEEDVVGAHGVSTGKIDDEKLFYLMSRGLTENNAKRFIINANYNIVIDKILDEKTKELVRKEINNRL